MFRYLKWKVGSILLVAVAQISCTGQSNTTPNVLKVDKKSPAIEQQSNGVASTLESHEVPESTRVEIVKEILTLESLPPGPQVAAKIMEITITKLLEKGVSLDIIEDVVADVARQNEQYLSGLDEASNRVAQWKEILRSVAQTVSESESLSIEEKVSLISSASNSLTLDSTPDERAELELALASVLENVFEGEISEEQAPLVAEAIVEQAPEEEVNAVLLGITPEQSTSLSRFQPESITFDSSQDNVEVKWTNPVDEDWSEVSAFRVYQIPVDDSGKRDPSKEVVLLGTCECQEIGCPERLSQCTVPLGEGTTTDPIFLSPVLSNGLSLPPRLSDAQPITEGGSAAVVDDTQQATTDDEAANQATPEDEATSQETTSSEGTGSEEGSGGEGANNDTNTPTDPTPGPAVLQLSAAASESMNITGGNSPGTAVVVTLQNTGESPTSTLLNPVMVGAGSANFEVLSNDCSTIVLQPTASCTMGVRPTATANGAYAANLSISDGTVQSNTLALAGTASGFTALIVPTQTTFTNMNISGGSSPGNNVVVTFRNNGAMATAALLAPSLGGANPAQFEVTANACTGVTLSPAESCDLSVRPLASTNGAFSASLTIGDGSLTSSSVQLSGTASGFAPSLGISPTTVTNMNLAGSSPGSVVNFTITNNGTAASATLQAPNLGGANPANFEVSSDTCIGTTLAPSANCTVGVRPTATADGSYSATLSVGDGSVTSGVASLSGSASGFAPVLVLTPSNQTGMDLTSGTSPGTAITFTVQNTGANSSASLQAISLSGDSGNFEVLNNVCTGTALAQSATCTFQVRPISAFNGGYSASLSVTDGSTGSNSVSLSGTASGFATPFTSTWKTDNNGPSEDNQVQLPLDPGGAYNFTVDWGDGTTSTVTSHDDTDALHTYSSAGTYEIRIAGTLQGLRFEGATDAEKITLISEWGTLSLSNIGGTFAGCSNLVVTAAGSPTLTGVTSLRATFQGASSFNSSLAGWNVSAVQNFSRMFEGATSFNQDLSAWNVSSGTDFTYLFAQASSFNGNITNWNVGNGTDFSAMFFNATSFNQNISGWDVSKGTAFSAMFSGATAFNQDLTVAGGWDVSEGLNFSSMFYNADAFNQDLSAWNVSKGTNFAYMFAETGSFNSSLSGWNVQAGLSFEGMFQNSVFNQSLSSWVPSSGTTFASMFAGNTSFNSPLFANTSSGQIFTGMFMGATTFNQDVSSMNVGSGVNFSGMFQDATSFNQPIGSWNVGNGQIFTTMFLVTVPGSGSFDQSLAGWDITSATNFGLFLSGQTLSQANYDALLISWEGQSVNSMVPFSAGSSKYSAGAAATARTNLTTFGLGNPMWIITDGGQGP